MKKPRVISKMEKRRGYHVHPQETWSRQDCEKFVKSYETNAFGDRRPYPGYLSPPVQVGDWGENIRYNGGCIRGGQFRQGEHFPLPKVPKGFKWKHILSWGWHLTKE